MIVAQPSFPELLPNLALISDTARNRPLGWHDYAEAWLPGGLGRLLDYGCNRGVMLERVTARTRECWGVDVDAEVLPSNLPGVRVKAVEPGKPLPFEDESFDTILILEVIEHVSDERRTLAELARILAPGGRLLLTTPHKGLLTFLDPGNLKFMAPALHRLVHTKILGDRAYYERRFGDARRRQQGMIADFTVDQEGWHRHYRYSQIRSFAPSSLETVAWSVYFPAMRALWCSALAAKVVSRGHYNQVPWPLNKWQNWASRQETRLGDQLVVLFRKSA